MEQNILEQNILNYTQNAEVALGWAYGYAKKHGLRYVTAEALLLGLTSVTDSIAYRILAQHGVTYDNLTKCFICDVVSSVIPAKVYYTEEANRIIQKSYDGAIQYNADSIGTIHILLALLQEPSKVMVNAFSCFKVDIQALINELSVALNDEK